MVRQLERSSRRVASKNSAASNSRRPRTAIASSTALDARLGVKPLLRPGRGFDAFLFMLGF
jgi:hypothetical protein